MDLFFFLKPFFLAFGVSLLATPLVIKILKRLGWVEDPQKKSHPKVIHEYPVPRGGGISIFLAIFITILVFLPLDKHLKGILLASLITLVTGLIDDLTDLNPYLRLFTNALAALIIIASGIGISIVTNPFGGTFRLDQPQIHFQLFGIARSIWLLSDIFAFFWIIWCMNIIGWSGGVDGQFPGFVTIATFTIGLLSLNFSQDIAQWPVIILAAAVSGAFLGFLPFNFYPQKIMPGYSAKSLAGLLIAVLSILSGAKIATAILVLGVPMINGLWVITRRILKKKSPVWGDVEHFHYLLLKLGWSKAKVAVFYWLISLVLGLIALSLNSQQKFYALIMLGLIFLAVSLLIRSWLKKNHSNFSA